MPLPQMERAALLQPAGQVTQATGACRGAVCPIPNVGFFLDPPRSHETRRSILALPLAASLTTSSAAFVFSQSMVKLG